MALQRTQGIITIALFHGLAACFWLFGGIASKKVDLISAILILLGLYNLACCLGLLMMKQWARIMVIILLLLSALGSSIMFITIYINEGFDFAGVSLIIIIPYIAIAAAILIYLDKPVIKNLFKHPSEVPSSTEKKTPSKSIWVTPITIMSIIVLIFIWAIWGIRGPNIRAHKMHMLIQPGMKVEEVISTLQNEKGSLISRCYERYTLYNQEEDEDCTQEKFLEAMNSHNNQRNGRIGLTFMGTAPPRTSFVVEFDSQGRVIEKSELRVSNL